MFNYFQKFIFTTKLGKVSIHGLQMFMVYTLLILPEVVYWLEALRLFMYQSTHPEITQTIVLWWYFTMALGNFFIFWVNEMGVQLYQYDDYQLFLAVSLQGGRFAYPFLAHNYKPLPGTD